MIIAREKKKENIAEYILYMWQIEDVIRANEFNLSSIESKIIAEFDVSPEIKVEMKSWYAGLIQQMQEQNIERKGHLVQTKELISELSFLHRSLINVLKDKRYQDIYRKAERFITEFNQVIGEEAGEIETCLNGMHYNLLLKLKGKPISSGTKEAFNAFRELLAYLAARYKDMQMGVSPN